MADQVLQEIRDRLNIADVISGYIQIKKAGTNFKALCPFHHEETPSLQISPQKQIWHCFGCGEGGDVFGFVMRYENVDFKEALKILAAKAGVQLPQYRPASPQEQTEKELLLRINDFAARYYHQLLTADSRGTVALQYLEQRGLTRKTIERWQIGFAPDDFHALEQALVQKKVSVADMVKAGVAAKNDRGQVYDRFRGRITFPVFDYHDNIVGFSARILLDDGKFAKYVNSPETVIYQKSKILFGLNFAKNAIRKQDEAVLVEGQMDCIALHQAGFENAVASSGTALTSEQLSLLGRLTKNLKFCFDADVAGQTAGRRAGELALKQGFKLKVISLEKVKDPDELVKKSPGLWEKAVSEAKWFLDWHMDFAEKQYAADPVEQKLFLSQTVVPLISFIADPLEQDHYVRRMAERFNISERIIRDQIKKSLAARPLGSSQTEAKTEMAKINPLEKQVLGGILAYPQFAQYALEQSVDGEFSDFNIREIVKKIRLGQASALVSDILAKEAIFMVESQVESLEGGREQQERELKKAFSVFKVNALKQQQQLLTMEIKQAESSGNKILLQELNRQFAAISQQRLMFEKQI